MIRSYLQVGEEEGFSARSGASSTGLDSHKYRVDLLQLLGVIEFQHPAFLVGTVFVEDAEVGRLLPVLPSATPSLEGRGFLETSLLVEVISVENQRFAFRVEHASVGFPCLSVAPDVINFGDIEVSSSHEFPDVTIMGEQFLLAAEFL